MLENHVDKVVDAIIKSAEITEVTLKWAESRRDALKALAMICNTFSMEEKYGGMSIKGTIEDSLAAFGMIVPCTQNHSFYSENIRHSFKCLKC